MVVRGAAPPVHGLQREPILRVVSMRRNPDLDGPFQPNVLNTVVFLVTFTMQISTFAVNYQVLHCAPLLVVFRSCVGTSTVGMLRITTCLLP